MKEVKQLLAIAISVCMLAFVGCEDDSGSSRSSSDSEYEEIELMVVARSSQPRPGNPEDVRVFDGPSGSDYRIVITSSTSVQFLRDSCSGWDNGSPSAIQIGDTLEFPVIFDDVDFAEDIPEVRPAWVRTFGEECLNPQIEDDDNDCCCDDHCSGTCGGTCGGCGNCNDSCPCSN